MAMIDIGTATGKVRIEYESAGAAKVTKEFESIRKQSAGAVTPFATWAEKIGAGSAALRQYNDIQKQVNEASKAARLFEQNLANVRARQNSSFRENYRANRLQIESQRSLQAIRAVAQQAERELPMRLATAGQHSADEFTRNFQRQGTTGIQRAGASIGKAGGAALGVALKGGALAAAAVATAAVAGVGYTLAQGFSRLERIDQANFKLKALGHSGKQVQAIMASANEAVDKTAFSLDSAATIAASAVAANIKPGKQLTQYLTNVADTAAIAGVSLDQMGGIFNGIVATNRVYIGDLSALGNLGIPIIQALAKEYGVTEAKLSDMVTNGQVDSAHFLAAINNNFGGAAKKMGASISGAVDNMKTAVARLGANFLAPLFGQVGSGDQGNSIALAIGKIQQGIDGLSNFLKSHQKGLIDFWAGMGKAALIAGRVILDVASFISDAVVKITEVFGDIVGWGAQAAAAVADAFGGDGTAKNLREFADQMHNLGTGLRENRDKNLPKFFHALDSGWEKINQWSDASKKAADETNDLGDQANSNAPKVKTFAEALEALGVSVDDTRKGIEGSNEDFQEFLDKLTDAKAPQDLIDTIKNLRKSFDESGRGAKQFADAVQKLSDKTISADDKANDLIDSLKTLGIIPAGNALEEYNKTLGEITDAQAGLVDVLDATGGALINQNGEINTSTKNGQSLFETIEKARQAMFKLSAEGEANPEEAWKRTHDGLMLVLNDFGIFGDQAESLIRKYLTDPHEFEVLYNSKNYGPVQQQLESLFLQVDAAKEKGENKIEFGLNIDQNNAEALKKQVEDLGGIWKQYDPVTGTAIVEMPSNVDISAKREELERLWNQDPTKLNSELNVVTKSNDIVNEVTGGPGNALHIPTVLDVQNPEVVPGGKPGPALYQGPGIDPKTGKPTGEFDRPAYTGPSLPEIFNPDPKNPNNQAANPFDLDPWSSVKSPADLFPKPNDPNAQAADPFSPLVQINQDQAKQLVALANNKDALSKALAENPDIANQLQGLVDQANAQGQNMGVAFAQGITQANDDVKAALLDLARMAGDYLGNSPAKYGPLAGKGWTLERGKTFTKAWAQGISSQSGMAKNATAGMVQASVMPFDDQFAQFIKDMQEFSDFGKHVLDFVSQIGDIAFSTLTLANDLSGGRLFPKTYVNDPDAKKSGNRLAPWSPVGAQGNLSTGGQKTAAPGALASNASKQQIADYITNKALSLGYSKKQADDFVIQAFGESGLRPNANGGNQDGTGDVGGIFQFTPGTWGNRSGSMWNAQDNIDAYFDLARERGLTPENFLAGSQLGTQVSIGGPWHPDNAAKGHLDAAKKGAQQYINGYTQSVASATQSAAVEQAGKVLTEKFGAFEPGGIVPKVSADRVKNGMVDGFYVTPDGKGGYTFATSAPTATGPKTPANLPAGGSQNTNAAIGYVEQIAKQFGLTLTSGKRSNAMTASGKSFHLSGEAGDFAIPGVNVPTENKRKFAEYVRDNLSQYVKELIYSDDAGGVNLYNGKPHQYNASTLADHRNHVHVAIQDAMVEALANGSVPGLDSVAAQANTASPVTLVGPQGEALARTAANTSGLPAFTQGFGLGLPDTLNQLAANDSQFAQAVLAARGAGSGLNQDQVVPLLQHLDSMIADQNNLNTPASKQTVSALETIRGGIMSNYGLKEGESPLDTAQTVANGISSIAADVFGVFDSTLKSIESAKNIGDTLVRGIANTEDIYNIVDNVQSFIELGQKIAQTVSDVSGFAASLVGAGGSGDASGASQGIAMALGAVSGISGIVSQALGAVNTAIDLGQEAYRLITKYVGRALTSWFGFPGASDIKYLLDEVTGQLQVYTSENPQMKHTFNTLGRELGGSYGTRVGAQNSFYIYQGPGQDPRDTMTDAMFAVKSSGQGALGYA